MKKENNISDFVIPKENIVTDGKEDYLELEPVITRGFEVVEDEFRKHKDVDIILPTKGTKYSAGNDFYSPETFTIKPNEMKVVWTDVKAFMDFQSVLMIYVRSSIGIKKRLVLANGTGVIDKDYYSNESNDGNIGIALVNMGQEDVTINEGERIAQGIFIPYFESGNTRVENETRVGGIGSSGK